VGSGHRCAPSTSPVRRCSLPVPAELQVDTVCQRRDVAAASAAAAGTTALAGVAAEKEARVCRRLWLVELDNYFWGRWREGPRWPRADPRGHARCPGRRKPSPNLGQGWIALDASVRLCRTAGEGACDARVRSNAFRCARTRCVGPLEMP
jgi:hypothetical protein